MRFLLFNITTKIKLLLFIIINLYFTILLDGTESRRREGILLNKF